LIILIKNIIQRQAIEALLKATQSNSKRLKATQSNSKQLKAKDVHFNSCDAHQGGYQQYV
jgi:hypothetical protein